MIELGGDGMDGCVGESNAGWQKGGVNVTRHVVMSAHHHRHDIQAHISFNLSDVHCVPKRNGKERRMRG